jgi:osmoprotectant transport system substrate-binding protein
MAAVCSLLFLAACSNTAPGDASTSYADAKGPVVIGADGSSASRVVAALYGELLTDAGVNVRMATTRFSSPAATVRAVVKRKIGLAPMYESTMLRALPRAQTMPGDMAATLSIALPPGVDALPPATADNGLVLAVTPATGRKYRLHGIGDLSKANGRLTLGGSASLDTEAPSTASLHEAYGVHLTDASTSATADVLVLRGSDPLLTQDGLLVLNDPQGVLPPDHVFPLIAAPYAGPRARKALARLNARLNTAQLALLVASVDGGEAPSATAQTWLLHNNLIG